MLTYCLIFKVLCLFQLFHFIKAVFLCQQLFSKVFVDLVLRQVILYHLKTFSSITFFKSFFDVLSSSQGQLILYHHNKSPSTLFFIFFYFLSTWMKKDGGTFVSFATKLANCVKSWYPLYEINEDQRNGEFAWTTSIERF